MGRAAGDMDLSGAKMNVKQYVEGNQSAERLDFFGEKVPRPDHVDVGLDELFPRETLAIRRGRDAVAFQYVPNIAL